MLCQTLQELHSEQKKSIYRTKYNLAEKDFNKKIHTITNLPIIPIPIIKWELKTNE